jgi:5-methylcytosine-specific restriction endonuclease McrA
MPFNLRPVQKQWSKTHVSKHWRPAVIRRLTPVYGLVCWYCGSSLLGVEIHIDHIIPRASGGENDDNNLALSCHWCNMAKGDWPLDYFLEWLNHIRATDSPITTRNPRSVG